MSERLSLETMCSNKLRLTRVTSKGFHPSYTFMNDKYRVRLRQVCLDFVLHHAPPCLARERIILGAQDHDTGSSSRAIRDPDRVASLRAGDSAQPMSRQKALQPCVPTSNGVLLDTEMQIGRSREKSLGAIGISTAVLESSKC